MDRQELNNEGTNSAEKQKIVFSYENSGVKTLNGFGVFFFIIGAIAVLVALIGLIMYVMNSGDSYTDNKETAIIGISLASSFFPIAIGLLVSGAVCVGLSSIARTALYKRALLEEKYMFENDGREFKW
jgi:Na+/proline symporter